MLKLYNTLTRKKDAFKPLKDKIVKMYSCGPTVYNYAHIGNFRAYICSDILKRWLIYRKYKVKHIMNITDVDDKTIRDSKKEGMPLKGFTRKYEKAFMEDIEILNILKADVYPRATEHINQMIELIQKLLKNGIAYATNDGVYFDIRKFKYYGRLSNIKIDEQKSDVRINNDEYEKDNAQDFALWKFWDKEDGEIYWNAPFGKGRPGWHIECSAMSMECLGQQLDIHTGGGDLIFPHHENEIAQSESVTGKKFVKYWLHNEYILVEGKKMSKSLGNFYTLRDLMNKGYSAKAIRYLLVSSHYRQQLNFTLNGIDSAQNSVDRLQEFIDMLYLIHNDKKDKSALELLSRTKDNFEKAMDDDLNISEALGNVFVMVKELNMDISNNNISETDAKLIIKFMEKVNIIIDVLDISKIELPKEVIRIVKERDKARIEKDWTTSDSLRNKLNNRGYIVKDTQLGTLVKLAKKK